MPRFRRSKFIVDRGLQLHLVGMSLGYVSLAVATLAFSLFLPLFLRSSALTDPGSAAAFEVASQVLYLHTAFWIPALLCVVVISLHSIWTSHRIAGPLYRLRMALLGISKGELPKTVRTRKGDFLSQEVTVVNEMVEALRGNVLEISRASDTLRQALTDLRTRVHDSPDKLTTTLDALQKQAERIDEKLAFFKIID